MTDLESIFAALLFFFVALGISRIMQARRQVKRIQAAVAEMIEAGEELQKEIHPLVEKAKPALLAAPLSTPLHSPTRHPLDQVITCQMESGEQFLFFYRESTRVMMLRHLGQLAADPNHPLTWQNVAYMAKLVREAQLEQEWEAVGRRTAQREPRT